MVNEVKFDQVDGLSPLLNSKKAQKTAKNPSSPQIQEEGVSVKIDSFQSMLVADTSVEENARVMMMKEKIESNHYKVDTDELAKKIYRNIFQPHSTIG